MIFSTNKKRKRVANSAFRIPDCRFHSFHKLYQVTWRTVYKLTFTAFSPLKLSHNTWQPWKTKKNFRACLTRSKRSVCFSPDPNISLKRDPSLWIPSLKLLILRMQRKMNSGRSFLVEAKLPFRFVGRVHPRCFRVSSKEQSATPLSSSGLHIQVHRSYIKLYLIFVILTIP